MLNTDYADNIVRSLKTADFCSYTRKIIGAMCENKSVLCTVFVHYNIHYLVK